MKLFYSLSQNSSHVCLPLQVFPSFPLTDALSKLYFFFKFKVLHFPVIGSQSKIQPSIAILKQENVSHTDSATVQSMNGTPSISTNTNEVVKALSSVILGTRFCQNSLFPLESLKKRMIKWIKHGGILLEKVLL